MHQCCTLAAVVLHECLAVPTLGPLTERAADRDNAEWIKPPPPLQSGAHRAASPPPLVQVKGELLGQATRSCGERRENLWGLSCRSVHLTNSR